MVDRNLRMNCHWGAADPASRRRPAAELVALAPDVIVALAAQRCRPPFGECAKAVKARSISSRFLPCGVRRFGLGGRPDMHRDTRLTNFPEITKPNCGSKTTGACRLTSDTLATQSQSKLPHPELLGWGSDYA